MPTAIARRLCSTGHEDQAIAGLLHDSVEDQGGIERLNDIRNRLGASVAGIVRSCSDSFVNSSGATKPDWHERKKAYLDHLETVGEETLLVSLCDKVHNARSILRDLRKADPGLRVWGRFSQPKAASLQYYRSLANLFGDRLPGQLSAELAEIVSILEKS